MSTINIDAGSDTIEITIGTDTLNISTAGTITTASYVNEGNKFYFDGASGNSYIWINSKGQMEIVHNGSVWMRKS